MGRGRFEASPLVTGPAGTTPVATGTSGPSCTTGAGTTFLIRRVVSQKVTPPPGTGSENSDRWRSGKRNSNAFVCRAWSFTGVPRLAGSLIGPHDRLLLLPLLEQSIVERVTRIIMCCKLLPSEQEIGLPFHLHCFAGGQVDHKEWPVSRDGIATCMDLICFSLRCCASRSAVLCPLYKQTSRF